MNSTLFPPQLHDFLISLFHTGHQCRHFPDFYPVRCLLCKLPARDVAVNVNFWWLWSEFENIQEKKLGMASCGCHVDEATNIGRVNAHFGLAISRFGKFFLKGKNCPDALLYWLYSMNIVTVALFNIYYRPAVAVGVELEFWWRTEWQSLTKEDLTIGLYGSSLVTLEWQIKQ